MLWGFICRYQTIEAPRMPFALLSTKGALDEWLSTEAISNAINSRTFWSRSCAFLVHGNWSRFCHRDWLLNACTKMIGDRFHGIVRFGDFRMNMYEDDAKTCHTLVTESI